MEIIDGSDGTARQLRRLLDADHLLSARTRPGTVTFLNSRPDKLAQGEALFAQKY